MKASEQIDFMIKTLEIAKDELQYAEKYMKKEEEEEKSGKTGTFGSYCYSHRNPNGTLIRENLKTVSRMASITAKKVTLSCYNSEIEE